MRNSWPPCGRSWASRGPSRWYGDDRGFAVSLAKGRGPAMVGGMGKSAHRRCAPDWGRWARGRLAGSARPRWLQSSVGRVSEERDIEKDQPLASLGFKGLPGASARGGRPIPVRRFWTWWETFRCANG